MNASEVRRIARSLGADLCGIAPVERFADAPPGFHPEDVFSGCRAVVVFAKRVPSACLYAESCVPQTLTSLVVIEETDRLGVKLALALEDMGVRAVLVPTDVPYEYWEEENQYGRAILSLRHAGRLAGLGSLGRNTLLCNKDYGNMIELGAVLVDAELEGDELAGYTGCAPDCRICLDSCPQKALDGVTVSQKLCRPLSNQRNEKGFVLKKCSLCRSRCPNVLGIEAAVA